MQKIILFYKFVKVKDPSMAMRWQIELCTRLNLKGRIIVAKHGINGTLGGSLKDLLEYKREMNKTIDYKAIDYKWSDGSRKDFPKLSVKVRPELVTLAPEENFDVFKSTKGLKPKDWHDYIKKHPEVIILDARNDYESDIGAFKGKKVIKPKIKAFKHIKNELEKLPKNQPILTYCTGDVRCEYLSAYMNHKGFDEVYHLEGGIVRYGEQFGDDGYWEGKCFVFDKRMNIGFSEKSKNIGSCVHCNTKTSRHINCADKSCNRLVLVCNKCNKKTHCKTHQKQKVAK